MQSTDARESQTRLVALACILLYPAIHLVIVSPHLYADGTNFFLDILASNHFSVWDKPRIFAQAISQAPLVLSLRLGINNMPVLGLIYGGSLLFIPALLWALAAFIHRQTQYFWNIVTCFAIAYIPVTLFAVGEYNICYAINALVVSCLWSEKISPWRSFWVLILSIGCTLTYESNAILAPLVIFFLLRTIFIRPQEKPVRLWLSLSAVAYLISFFISLYWIVNPRDPGNASGAMSAGPISIYLPLLIAVGLVNLIRLSKTPFQYKASLVAASSCIAALPFYFWYLLQIPQNSYLLRTVVNLGIVLCLFTLPALKSSHFVSEGRGRLYSYSLASVVLLIALSSFGLSRALEMRAWVGQFRSELAALSVSKPVDATGLSGSPLTGKYDWISYYPRLSLALGADPNRMILNRSSYKGWAPNLSPAFLDGLARYSR